MNTGSKEKSNKNSITVDSRLLEIHDYEKPVSSGTQVSIVFDENDNLNIYSVGNNGSLYAIFQDIESGTDWNVVKTQQSAIKLATQLGNDIGVNQDLIFAARMDEYMGVKVISFSGNGSNRKFSTNILQQGFKNKPNIIGSLIASNRNNIGLITCINRSSRNYPDGNLYGGLLNVYGPVGFTNFVYQDGAGTLPVSGMKCLPVLDSRPSQFSIVALWNGQIFTYWTDKEPNAVICEYTGQPGNGVGNDIDVISYGEDTAAIIALNTYPTVTVKILLGTINKDDGKTSWTNEWWPLDITLESSSGQTITPQLTNIRAVCDSQDNMYILGLDKGGILWCGLNLEADTSTENSFPMAPIGEICLHFDVRIDSSETINVVQVTGDNNLVLLKKTNTVDSNWTQEIIDVNVTPTNQSSLFTKVAYLSTLSLDAALGEISNVPASIMTSTETIATINGVDIQISPLKPAEVKTDENGQITILTSVDETLASPIIHGSFRSIGINTITLDPTEQSGLISKMINVNKTILEDATDPQTGKKILSTPQNAEGMASSVNNLMEYATGNSKNQAPWCIRFENNKVEFEFLSESRADKLFAEAIKNSESLPSNYLGFDDIGAVFNATWNGAAKITSIAYKAEQWVITPVIDGLELALHMAHIPDPRDVVWDIFRGVFDAAGPPAGILTRWVLKFLGNWTPWPEILSAKETLKNSIYSNASTLQNTIKIPSNLNTSISDAFNLIKNNIDGTIEDLNSTYGNDTIQSISSRNSYNNLLSINGRSYDSITNHYLDKTLSVFPSISLSIPALESSNQDFIENLIKSLSGFESFTKALGNIENDITSLSPAKLASTFEGCVDSLLDTSIDLLEDGIVVLEDALNNSQQIIHALDQPISIPFWSTFYEYITGGDQLTALDLACLLPSIAIGTANWYEKDEGILPSSNNKRDFTIVLAVWALMNSLTEMAAAKAGVANSGNRIKTLDNSLTILTNSLLIAFSLNEILNAKNKADTYFGLLELVLVIADFKFILYSKEFNTYKASVIAPAGQDCNMTVTLK